LSLLCLLCGCEPAGEPEPDAPVNPAEVTSDKGVYTLQLDPASDPFLAGEASELALGVLMSGEGIPGASVMVTPFMPDMGHGIETEPTISDEGEGSYLARWSFNMPGYWELEISVDGEHGADTATVAYEVE